MAAIRAKCVHPVCRRQPELTLTVPDEAQVCGMPAESAAAVLAWICPTADSNWGRNIGPTAFPTLSCCHSGTKNARKKQRLVRPVSVGAGCNAAVALTTTGPAPEATTPRCIRHDPVREESCARLRTGCCTGRENIRCHPPAKACPGLAAGPSTDTSEDFLAGLRPARLADLITADFPSRERKTRILPSRVMRAILLQTRHPRRA